MAYTETAAQFFERLPRKGLGSDPARACLIEVELEGPEGGTWSIDLAAGRVAPVAGNARQARPDVLVRARARDFMALVEGRMSAEEGLLTERLHLAGEAGAIARALTFLGGMA